MKAEVTTLATMMEGDEEYVIPYFQRAYAWNQENQWAPLWDDIVNVANAIANADNIDDVPPHFMGPVVIQERGAHPDGRPPGYIVVDGQQRMTTLLIILKALGDAAAECDQTQLSEQFLSKVWNEIGLNQKTPKVRHTNKRDSLNLRGVLNGINGTDSDNRMYECYDFFNSSAVAYMRRGQSTEQQCKNLLTTLKSKMQTALLLLDVTEQPNVVFETLNGRAEPLRPFELVKNTIMYEGQVTEDEQKANALWHSRLESKWWQDGEMDYFLADWLTSRMRRRITTSRVSTEFRAHTQEAKARGRNIQYVTDRMNRAAKIYEDVCHHEFSDTKPASSRLLRMRLHSTLPVILWLWDDDNGVSRRERQTCLRLIENYAIRRVIVGLNVGDVMANAMTNNLLPQLSQASDEGASHSKTVARVLKAPSIESARWPTDSDIIKRLSENPHEMSNPRRNVVLEALESQLRREMGMDPLNGSINFTDLMPGGEIGRVNYPIKGNWTSSRIERRERSIKLIGNWTIVKRKLSSNDNNAAWPEKAQVLEKSASIALTREVLEQNQDDWTEQHIFDRSTEMAYLAVRAWPYPEDDYHPRETHSSRRLSMTGRRSITMSVGIIVPLPAYTLDPAFIAKKAEELGFESIWYHEHPILPVHSESPFPATGGEIPWTYRHFSDPYMSLAMAAAVTEKIKLCTGITLVPERNPLILAKQIAVLDRHSNGRFVFGVGAGWNREETEMMGGDFDHRWTQTEEAVNALKELWTQDQAEFHGRYYNFPPVYMYPKPAQQPHPPVLLGGNARNVLRRVARYADGWLPNRATPGQIEDSRKQLDALAAERGRDPQSLTISVFGQPPDATRQTVDDFLNAGAQRVCVWPNHNDSEAEMAQQLEQMAQQLLR